MGMTDPEPVAALAFDPRAAVDRLRDRVVARAGRPAPEKYFRGMWADRHLLNVPGPFYGAATDTCGDGPPLAPSSLLYDHEAQGFVWRQPRGDDETHALMSGASSDPFCGYGWDGDDHWTPELVRAWWRERHAQQQAIELMANTIAGPVPENPTARSKRPRHEWPINSGLDDDGLELLRRILAAYFEYRSTAMQGDLRSYLFRLEEGRYPAADAALPAL